MQPRFSILLALAAVAAWGQEPGSGPVSQTIRTDFIRSFFRNGFSNLVSLPPVADVRRLGSVGLVQEFLDLNRQQRYALVRASTNDFVAEGVETVFQVYPANYTYYSSIGPNTAGYPTTDTTNCPAFSGNSCTFQIFDRNHALFVFQFATSTINGTNFAVRDPFFTRWRLLGAMSGMGAAIGPEEAVTSGAATGVAGTLQRFQGGGIYNLTSGALTGRLVPVQQPVWDVYQSQGGHGGFLGFPTGDPLLISPEVRRQNFEGGAIDLQAGTATLRLPVATVVVDVSAPTQRLGLGDTITLQASTFAGNGGRLEGRQVAWLSSNTRILALDTRNNVATVRAVGGGTAAVTAVSEGKSSRAVTFFVSAPCCQIGEGAPTALVSQSFAEAVTRGRLNLKLPSPSPVRRVGTGYVQEALGADGATVYLLAKPDSSPTTFIVSGAILARHEELGGPGGALGYPVADQTLGGRQVFENGALAGSPVTLVTAPVLTRWAAQGYESSPARLPAAPPKEVLSFNATLGVSQTFTGGVYYAHASGSLINRVFLVLGATLTRYDAAGGAAGALGLPVSDETTLSGRRRQEFEGGFVSYALGETEAQVEAKPRRPQISATPGSVAAGSRIRVAAGGFREGSRLRITVGSQPDFLVTTVSGAYAWEIFVPVAAESGLVNLRAADINGSDLAVGSYVVLSTAETLARVTKIRGDLQTGYPGARLPLPLRILVRDENGTPLTGVTVRFNPSPGAEIEDASARTDEKGEAQAYLRLPLGELPALATADAGRQVVTFAARTITGSFTNFPAFKLTGSTAEVKLGAEQATLAQRGALLASSASILRYLQNNNDLGSPNGLADPLALNAFLRDLCVFDSHGEKICDGLFAAPGAGENNVNPWRLPAFTGGGFDAVPVEATREKVRDVLAEGRPVLLGLALFSGNTPLGSHFVVATGVGAGGQMLIHDPSPVLDRALLDDYLAGFTAGGASVRGVLTAAIDFDTRASGSGAFVVAAGAEPSVASRTGFCGSVASWPSRAFGAALPGSAGASYFRYCPGGSSEYQLEAAGPMLFLDLGNTGGQFALDGAAPAYRASRLANLWQPSPLDVSFSAASVLNAASLTPSLSPGTLATLLGSGLAKTGEPPVIAVGGQAATVIAATPFQVSFRIPESLAPGVHPLAVTSPFGQTEREVNLVEFSPALFTSDGRRAVAVNQNGAANTTANPARRGEVIVFYGTGFGALRAQGNQQLTVTPPVVEINGRTVAVQYAGASPGQPGVYQFNVAIPTDLPPGLSVEVRFRQGSVAAPPVLAAIQ